MEGRQEQIRQAAIEKGLEPPDLLDHTSLDAAELQYWHAYARLDNGRQRTFGPTGGVIEQAIEYTQISRYARDWGFAGDREDFDHFVMVIQRMDAEHRKFSGKLRG